MLEEKINKRNINIIVGVLLIVFGIFLISFDYLREKKNRAFEIINFELYNLEEKNDKGDYENDDLEDIRENDITIQTIPDDYEEPEIDSMPEIGNNESNININYYYIGLLEIPKIGLKKGFVDPSSVYNNVDHNITIINTSVFPDVENSNLILAAHSGTGYISYFKNLYKLVIGDKAYIYYNNVKYTYEIVDIYLQPKTGKISIYRDYDKTTLTLITCTKNDESTQTVYIANLIDKANY